jgi:hypothetical protein
MNEEIEVNPSAAAAEPSWRRYPHLEAAIEAESAAVLANMEQTRAEIERIDRTGGAREKERARTALVAYDRALDLYHHLAARRDQLLRAPSNMRNKTPIND